MTSDSDQNEPFIPIQYNLDENVLPVLEQAITLLNTEKYTEAFPLNDQIEKFFLSNAAQALLAKSRHYRSVQDPFNCFQSLSRALSIAPHRDLQKEFLQSIEYAIPYPFGALEVDNIQRIIDSAYQDSDPELMYLISHFLRSIDCHIRSRAYRDNANRILTGFGAVPLNLEDEPRYPHVILATLPYSGSSALDPILRDLLACRGYDLFGTNCTSTLFEPFARGPAPLYLWTHAPMLQFYPVLSDVEERGARVVVLHRDPRDAVVSRMKDYHFTGYLKNLSEKEVILKLLDRELPLECFQIQQWMNLPERNRIVLTFEQIKSDMVKSVEAIFDYFEFPLDRGELEGLVNRYSFESITKRSRGDDGETVRNKYVLRKGVSGEWKHYFDDQIAQAFKEKCNEYLLNWGYETSANW